MNILRKLFPKEEKSVGENQMDKVGAAPLQSEEEQDQVRKSMEAELDEQRNRRNGEEEGGNT